MFDLKSYILGMVFMALMTFLDKPIMSFLEKHKASSDIYVTTFLSASNL